MSDPRPIIVWRYTDGKPGHEKQTAGLLQALQTLHACEVFSIKPHPARHCLASLLRHRPPALPSVSMPDLAIGAGRATQLSLITAARTSGAVSVVLMNPAYPRRCFDLCLIPRHDDISADDHVVLTEGPITTLRHAKDKEMRAGLILLGGPSPHFDWDETHILQQVASIIASTPQLEWCIADSRRTPSSTSAKLAALQSGKISYMPHDRCAPGWLDSALSRCTSAWVSGDSVSMVYEAVSAGCRTGIIEPGRPRSAKIRRSLDSLMKENRVTSFNAWQASATLPLNDKVLDEAGRCAGLLYTRFLQERLSA